MEVNEIKNHIQTKQFNSFYIFAGSEWKVQRIYIDMISSVSGKPLNYIDSISAIHNKLNNKSFVQKSYVYVVRDDKELIQNEKLQAELNTLIGNNILILLLTTVDKRLKFYKQYKDTIVEFEALKPMVLRKYIQKEINLSDKNCDMLMEVCENDYGRCLLEIDKIKQYADYLDTNRIVPSCDEDGVLQQFIQEGVIYQPPKDAIFDFVDAILDDKVKLAFRLYHDCLEVGEATMVMISVLYNNAKAVLQVQRCTSDNISKSTGLSGFQIMNAKKHLKVFKNKELLRIMSLCQECQEGIVSGTMEEEYAMEYILTEVM